MESSPPQDSDPFAAVAPSLSDSAILEPELFPDLPLITAPSPAARRQSDAAPEEKAPGAFKTIREAADSLEIPQHVLRFWESKFREIKPLKRSGGRRYYRPEDMEVLIRIKQLLYGEGYTIKGARKAIQGRHEAEEEAIDASAAWKELHTLHSELGEIGERLRRIGSPKKN